MSSIDLSDREISYILLALRKHEEMLLAVSDEDEGDSINDLLIIQALRKKLKSHRQQPDA